MMKKNLIETAIKEMQKKLTGKLGAAFDDLETDESVVFNGNTVFPMASIFKIFVLAELYRRIDQGTISPDQRFPLSKDFKSAGSGVVFLMDDGADLTVHDYALLMMMISDNTSADLLYRLVGKENIEQNVIRPLGLTHTKIDFSCSDLFTYYCNTKPTQSLEEKNRAYFLGDYHNSPWHACTTAKNDETTPMEINKMLKTIYHHQWCNEATCDQILDIMKKCQTNSRIPKYLPKGIEVAHKTGTFDRLSNDAGIVYTEKGNYVLSLFYNGNLADENEYYHLNEKGFYGDEALATLSRQIYDIYTGVGKV